MKIRCFRDPNSSVTITRYLRKGEYLYVVKDASGKKYFATAKTLRPEHRNVLLDIADVLRYK